jgi:c-di-GMP-binding flagellar brake protein YcgR
MKEISHRLLSEASPDELLACIQLLAISVVQHRVKCGFVKLTDSTEQLITTQDNFDATGLFVKSNEVLEEALEMVRALAATPVKAPAIQMESGSTSADNRTQIRLKISIPVKVSWPQDSKPINAKLEDISWGGASIHMHEPNMDAGDILRIFLPRPQGGLISIEAKVLRVLQYPDGNGHSVATRFSSLSTRDEAKLEEILEHLSLSADHEGQRRHARLTQRLELQFDGEQELLTTLDDISAGGLGITVPEPVQLGQSLQILISTLDETCFLKLRARVVRQEPIRLHAMHVYRVGLKFEHPSAELQKRTSELIAKVAAVKNK